MPDSPAVPSQLDQPSDGGAALCVVGVGASAGGLESLEKFFNAVPLRSGMAFVVVQHLSPDHESLMGELLARLTALPVKQAVHDEPVERDHVYLLPPGKELEMKAGRLQLFERDREATLSLPIDRFLTSLSADFRDRSMAVILSGSGTDGSRGIRRIHDAGGFVAVEEPGSARFDGMPRAAVSTQIVDVILPAEELPALLIQRSMDHLGPAVALSDEVLPQITALLRKPLGIDFGHYKTTTLLRRIRRRLRVQGIDSFAAYLKVLQNDQQELIALGNDLLIGVTAFFRDPATWEIMERQVIPQLFRECDPERGVRCWVAGCATGEEAYTLALLLLEAAPPGVPVRVFATDVHRGSLSAASQGIYREDRLGPLTRPRMERFFVRSGSDKVQVSDELRGAVVFAAHNVLRDAPFTQLDLVSCRNLLIYFRPKTQTQALGSLQYGLRVGGVMLLGPSETLGDVSADYDPIDESHRIYQRSRLSRRMPELLTMRRSTRPSPPEDHYTGPRLSLYRSLLDRNAAATLVVGPDRALLECLGGAHQYLLGMPGDAGPNVLDLVPEAARSALSALLSHVTQTQESVSCQNVPWPVPDEDGLVTLRVETLSHGAYGQVALVTLSPAAADLKPSDRTTDAVDLDALKTAHFAALQEELSVTKGQLQSAVEDLETSGEEMQATNEELFASNEELQSTNEELHSVNEELHTVNAELQTKIRELSEINRDMQQLFENIDIAILFLDDALRIRRYTPAAANLFGLLPHDVGRPLANLNLALERATLMEDLQGCLAEGTRQTYEARDDRGRTFLVQIHAARHDDGDSSVVLLLSDTTSLQAARNRARLLSAAADSSTDAIILLDLLHRVIEWNSGAERLYGICRSEILGKTLDAIIPDSRKEEFLGAMAELSRGETGFYLETERLHREGQLLHIGTSVSPVYDEDDHLIGYSKFDRNIGEQREREAVLREREQRLADSFNNSPDMLASVDLRTGRLVDFNETLANILGYAREELEGCHFSQLYTPESQIDAHAAADRLRKTGELRDIELTMRRTDGSTLPVSLNSTGVRDDEGNVVRSRTVIRDITIRKRAEAAMTEAVRMREYFLATASHELRTPMHAIRSASDLLADEATTPEDRIHATTVLQRQTAHVTQLLDALLDVARMTQNRLDLSLQPVDLRTPVDDAIDAFKYAYAERGVLLVSEGTSARMPTLADPVRIQQAISNLLGNALRHSPTGSTVTVRSEIAAGKAVISVSDQGDGIAPDMLESIFEAFASGSHDRVHRGSLGLGLSLARRIIAGHGGTLVASSAGVGLGASFRLEVPLQQQDVVSEQTRRVRTSARIVLIEDQDDSREMLAMLLKRRGDEVFKAANGEEGIALILKERPDVALVDIGLPDMDGHTVAKRVRAELSDAVPLVALTGYGQREDVQKSYESGFRMHLTKPISMQALDQAICDVVPPDHVN